MTNPVRSNGVKKIFDAGNVALGANDALYSPRAVELFGALGLDFVWLDFEHGGPSVWNGDRLEEYLRAAELTDTELLVRIPESNPALVRKSLDAGVRNVLVPRIETAQEIRTAVEAAYFNYDGGMGERGLSGQRVTRYGLDMENHIAGEDEEVLIGAMVENESAVENLDEILAVPKLGFVFFGPFDMSVSKGRPMDVRHEEIAETAREVREACLAADIPIGGLGLTVDDTLAMIEEGYQLISVGNSVTAIKDGISGWFDAFDEEAPETVRERLSDTPSRPTG